jgi:hypothetical protein
VLDHLANRTSEVRKPRMRWGIRRSALARRCGGMPCRVSMAQYKNSHLYKKAALTTDTIVRQNRGVEIDKTGAFLILMGSLRVYNLLVVVFIWIFKRG